MGGKLYEEIMEKESQSRNSEVSISILDLDLKWVEAGEVVLKEKDDDDPKVVKRNQIPNVLLRKIN